MLSRSSRQAIGALVELAGLPDEGWDGTSNIARRIDAPENYLGKLLQILSADGLVVSRRGRGGGFRLGRDPRNITLFEIVDPIEHIGDLQHCAMGLGACRPSRPCPLHDRWMAMRKRYLDFLKGTTLADILVK